MDAVEKKVTSKVKEISSQVVEVIEEVAGDLKELAGKYGAWIVMFLVVVYLWKKIR